MVVRSVIRTGCSCAPFFTLVVPLMLLITLDLVYGSRRMPTRAEIRFPQFYFTGMITFATVNACYIKIINGTTLARDVGMLKRVRGTPMPGWVYLTGEPSRQGWSAAVHSRRGPRQHDRVRDGHAHEHPARERHRDHRGNGMLLIHRAGRHPLVPTAEAALPIAYGTFLPLSFVSDVFFPSDTSLSWLQHLAGAFPLRPLSRALAANAETARARPRAPLGCTRDHVGMDSRRDLDAALLPVGACSPSWPTQGASGQIDQFDVNAGVRFVGRRTRPGAYRSGPSTLSGPDRRRDCQDASRIEEVMTKDIEVHTKERPIARLWDWFEPFDMPRFFDAFRTVEDRMRVEEEIVDGNLVIRAELPGVDPDKDVEITVQNDVLTLTAERRREQTKDTNGGLRSEFHYGSLTRSMHLPKGTTVKNVKASYHDGILEVKVPAPKTADTVQRVTISKA